MNINPQYIEKDEDFTGKSFNNMRFFHKKNLRMSLDSNLMISGAVESSQSETLELQKEVCEAILKEGELLNNQINELSNKVNTQYINDKMKSGIDENKLWDNGYKPVSVMACCKDTPNQNEVAKAIVGYINLEMTKDEHAWRQFPRILIKALTSNSLVFSNLIDMSNITDNSKFTYNLEVVFRLVS